MNITFNSPVKMEVSGFETNHVNIIFMSQMKTLPKRVKLFVFVIVWQILFEMIFNITTSSFFTDSYLTTWMLSLVSEDCVWCTISRVYLFTVMFILNVLFGNLWYTTSGNILKLNMKKNISGYDRSFLCLRRLHFHGT